MIDEILLGHEPWFATVCHSLGEDAIVKVAAHNCRWVSCKQQARNNRHNHLVTIDGKTMPLIAAAEKYGISINTVKMRIRNGWSDVDAVTTPSARSNSERQKALLKLPYLGDQG